MTRLIKFENVDGNSAWVAFPSHFRLGERIIECPTCESEEFVRTIFSSKDEHELKCDECDIEFIDLY